MHKYAAMFLQGVVVLVALGALAFLLWEPQVEGRNAHATFFEVYFHDPFLAFGYLASVSFFVALFQAFKVLGQARQNWASAQLAARRLRKIQFCGLLLVAFVAIGEIWILITGDPDDRPAGFFMGMLIVLGAVTMAAAAKLLEQAVQNAAGSGTRVTNQ